MRRIGVAFGGGGARGLVHVGILRALHKRKKFLPSIVAGTSAGSLAAALYAGGLSQNQIEETAKKFDWFHHVIDFADTVKNVLEKKRGGLVSNANLGDTINKLIDDRSFDELDIDLAVIATDIENLRRVIFTSHRVAEKIDKKELLRFLPEPTDLKPGCSTMIISDYNDVGMAVRASCAIPGFFLPVEIRGMRLLDGGIVDQVPVDVIKAMGADTTIGICLALSVLPQKIKTPADAMEGTIGVLGIHQLRKSLDMADIGFQISGIEKRSIINIKQYDLIDLGEQHMSYWLDVLAEKVKLKKYST